MNLTFTLLIKQMLSESYRVFHVTAICSDKEIRSHLLSKRVDLRW